MRENAIKRSARWAGVSSGLSLLGLGLGVLLAGCAAHGGAWPDDPGIAETPKATGRLTIDSPIEAICDDPRGRDVLDRNLPNLRKNPNYFLFKGLSLRDVAKMSGGKISRDTLKRVQLDLASLPPNHSPAADAAN
jgi:hypothetical protein